MYNARRSIPSHGGRTAAALVAAMLVTPGLSGSAKAAPELETIQRAIEAEALGWRAGLTPFMTGARPLPPLAAENPLGSLSAPAEARSSPLFYAPPLAAASITDTRFSWQDVAGKDYMTPVRDQSSCGSCFVFSSIGAVEALFAIAVDESHYDLDLSEQHVLSCIAAGSCGDGGVAQEVGEYLKSGGTVDETCRPYLATERECSADLCANSAARTARIASWSTSIAPWTEQELKEALLAGPLVVNMKVYTDFYAYTSGVYRRSSSAEAAGWHAVTLVGWDDADESWIVRNSWGQDWGDNGYFKIWRESDCQFFVEGVCFASNAVTFTVEKEQAPAYPCLEPWLLEVEAELGTAVQQHTFVIENCGRLGPLHWAAEALPTGVTLTAAAGVLAPGARATVTARINPGTLGVGDHHLQIPVSGEGGNSVLDLRVIVSEPNVPPVPDFVASPLGGPPPLSVTFENRTTGPVQSYRWDFGDGGTSMQAAPTHTYLEPGRYTVSLSAFHPQGVATETRVDLILVQEDWTPGGTNDDETGGTLGGDDGGCSAGRGSGLMAALVLVLTLSRLTRRRRCDT